MFLKSDTNLIVLSCLAPERSLRLLVFQDNQPMISKVEGEDEDCSRIHIEEQICIPRGNFFHQILQLKHINVLVSTVYTICGQTTVASNYAIRFLLFFLNSMQRTSSHNVQIIFMHDIAQPAVHFNVLDFCFQGLIFPFSMRNTKHGIFPM